MTRRPPTSSLERSSAASDVYKRQGTKVKVEGEELLVMKESDILAVLEG